MAYTWDINENNSFLHLWTVKIVGRRLKQASWKEMNRRNQIKSDFVRVPRGGSYIFALSSRSLLRSTATTTSPQTWRGCGGIWRTPTHATSSPTPAPPTWRSRRPTKTWRGDWPSNSPTAPEPWQNKPALRKHRFSTNTWPSLAFSESFGSVVVDGSEVCAGLFYLAAPDVMDFSRSVRMVFRSSRHGKAEVEQKINQIHLTWLAIQKQVQILLLWNFWHNSLSLFFFPFRSNTIVSVYIYSSWLTQSSLSYMLQHTAKRFTSCWCQGRSLYLFPSPQKSSLTPVFIIEPWLPG